MSTATVRLPKLHPAQKKVVAEARRFNTVVCGRRFGKTALALDRLIDAPKAALDGFSVAYMTPSYKLLDDVWRQSKTVLTEVITRVDSQQKRIELCTSGSIDFWTMDNPESVGRGRKYTHIIVDEGAFVRELEEAWTKSIRATLSDYQGSAWFMGTPSGMNYFHDLFQFGQAGSKTYDADWMSWQMPTSMNPFIKAEEIEAARKQLPQLVFNQEYLAQFVSSDGALLKPNFIKYGNPPAGSTFRTTFGIDLAITTKESSDYTCICVLQQTTDGMLYIRQVHRFKMEFHKILQEIQRLASKWNPNIIAIEDVAFQKAIVQELLRNTHLNVRGVTPDRDKVARFMPVLNRFEQGFIHLDKELSLDFERELLAFPVGANDDQVDSLSLAYKALTYTNPVPMTLQVGGL